MSDLFHPSVPFDFIDRVFGVMALADRHIFQVLTKRPERMAEYLNTEYRPAMWEDNAQRIYDERHPGGGTEWWPAFQGPLPNVWLGTSCEDQETANERIPYLLRCEAAVRWISAEPLIGPMDLNPWLIVADDRGDGYQWGLDWVVVGGESGKRARPCHPDWVRQIRDDCVMASVAFNFKQWGEWVPLSDSERPKTLDICIGGDGNQVTEINGIPTGNVFANVRRVGKRAAGRFLDGVQYDEYPAK